MERRRLAGIGIAVPFHRDKISECYDQLTNPTLKKVRAFSCFSLLKKSFYIAGLTGTPP